MAEYIEYLPVFGAIHDLSMDAFRRNDKKEVCCYNKALSILCKAPAADVAPVVHGRWIKDVNGFYYCPYCVGISWTLPDVPNAFKHCPNCGARMDGE